MQHQFINRELFTGLFEMIQGSFGFCRALLAAAGLFWLLQGSFGCCRALLATAGLFYPQVAAA